VVSVAIVDDYPVMRELLREFLRRADFDVVGEAGAAHELMAGYSTWDPDVLILDILLPDANGVEVTKQILAMDPAAKILVISGLEDDSKLTGECLKAGAKAFLPKPFSSDDLIRTVRGL
jgi:DNA-binding NarL/FixJ family response regulator